MYNTIIFDMDGTLLYTLEDLCDSVNVALQTYQLPTRSLEEVCSFIGNGAKQLITLAVPEGSSKELISACYKTYQEHYSQNMQNKTRPYDGILVLLKELSERNIKLAIVSNKFDHAVKELSNHYFGDFIKIAIGESETVGKKPAPEGVFAALKQLGSKASECLYVGDSDVDVITAKNAGVTSVGVTWGFRSRKLLEAQGADYIIDSPMELLDLL